jgi:hypothetical protein
MLPYKVTSTSVDKKIDMMLKGRIYKLLQNASLMTVMTGV